jgi:hypothetical protein
MIESASTICWSSEELESSATVCVSVAGSFGFDKSGAAAALTIAGVL